MLCLFWHKSWRSCLVFVVLILCKLLKFAPWSCCRFPRRGFWLRVQQLASFKLQLLSWAKGQTLPELESVESVAQSPSPKSPMLNFIRWTEWIASVRVELGFELGGKPSPSQILWSGSLEQLVFESLWSLCSIKFVKCFENQCFLICNFLNIKYDLLSKTFPAEWMNIYWYSVAETRQSPQARKAFRDFCVLQARNETFWAISFS